MAAAEMSIAQKIAGKMILGMLIPDARILVISLRLFSSPKTKREPIKRENGLILVIIRGSIFE
jgi:hypothetical protein